MGKVAFAILGAVVVGFASGIAVVFSLRWGVPGLGQAFAIDTMPMMYAARINIHLHRQAFYGDLPAHDALDEEWNDDDH